MADRRAIAGARAKLYFNGVEAGWATGVSASENIQLQRIDVLGNIDSVEIEPIGRSVSMTADYVRIKSESLQAMGLWPQGGTAAVLDFPAMSAEIMDEVNDEVIWRLTGLKCETRNWRFDRQGVMTSNATYQGLRMHDETGS